MKFANINGVRHLPQKGFTATCPSCNSVMIAKCGKIKVHHWAHKGEIKCDHWWEPETEWHRKGKEQFPVECQEVVHRDLSTGEIHIADVETYAGWVIEFQNSNITPEEQNSRNNFYKKLVWVVNGNKSKNYQDQFELAKNTGTSIKGYYRFYLKHFPAIEKWFSNHALVFFDFGNIGEPSENSELWLLMPKINDEVVYIRPCTKQDFIEIFSSDSSEKSKIFNNCIKNWSDIFHKLEILFEEISRDSLFKLRYKIKTKKYRSQMKRLEKTYISIIEKRFFKSFESKIID